MWSENGLVFWLLDFLTQLLHCLLNFHNLSGCLPHTHNSTSLQAMESSVFTHSKQNDLSAALPLQMWNGICCSVLFWVHFSLCALYQFPNRVRSLTDNVCEDGDRLLGSRVHPGETPLGSAVEGLHSPRRSISFCTICQIVFVHLRMAGYLHLVESEWAVQVRSTWTTGHKHAPIKNELAW